MSIKDLYLPKNFYTSPKQISGYAPVSEPLNQFFKMYMSSDLLHGLRLI